MEQIDSFVTIAKASGREGFLKQFDHLFFVRRPVTQRPAATSDDLAARSSARTKAAKSDPLEMDLLAEQHLPPSWRVAKVRKRDGSPRADVLTVGRVPTCDVYLAFPSVSKLHASLMFEGTRISRVIDEGSTNGTWLNGTALSPGKASELKLGDHLRFGGVDVELLDAAAFYELLTGLPAA